MCTITIPYFKEVIVMAFTCPKCGYKSSETKVAGALSEKGVRISLKVKNSDDLKRDLYKSDSARLIIPEIELEQGYGTLGGVYSTVEGLIT
jgi:zinc finger protein